MTQNERKKLESLYADVKGCFKDIEKLLKYPLPDDLIGLNQLTHGLRNTSQDLYAIAADLFECASDLLEKEAGKEYHGPKN